MRLVLLALLASISWAQTKVDYPTQVKRKPITIGPNNPASCTFDGDEFFNTQLNNLYVCSNGAYVLANQSPTQPILVYNVKTYGAVGNNIADDTGAFQAAVAAATAANGGIVWMPCGTYKISAPVVFAIPGLSLSGTSTSCSIINYPVGTANPITWQMNPFTITPAGEFSDFTVLGNASASAGILSGQIVGSSWRNINVSGFTSKTTNGGLGGAGIRLHNFGNLATWTEQTTFINVGLGGSSGGQYNQNGLLMDSDVVGDSFGHNHFLGVHVNVSTGQVGVNLASGFFYDSDMDLDCNADNNLAGTTAALCMRSNSNWDSINLQAKGEFISSGPGTGTQYAVQVEAGGRFANLLGSKVVIFATGGATLPWNNLHGSSASPDVTLTEFSSITSYDTGSFPLSGISSSPEPIQRANYGSIGLLIGNNIESPYVSMFQGSGNKFQVLTVPTNGIIGTNGIDVASIDTGGNLFSSTLNTQCNSLVTACVGPVVIDGQAAARFGGYTSAHRSGLTAFNLATSNGINESMSGDPNFSGGTGFVLGVNIAHPIAWGYTSDPVDFAWYEKTFQTSLTSGNLVAFMGHGGTLGLGGHIDQLPGVNNIAGSCTVNGAISCAFSFSNVFISPPICVASPTFEVASGAAPRWWVTSSITSCTVTFEALQTGTVSFVAVGNPN